eukprot:g1460.t1
MGDAIVPVAVKKLNCYSNIACIDLEKNDTVSSRNVRHDSQVQVRNSQWYRNNKPLPFLESRCSETD